MDMLGGFYALTSLASAYYETLGLDRETGKPFPDTLCRLGLEDIIPEVWGTEEARVCG